MPKMSKFIDTSKCTGCRGCQTACKGWNELPAEILEFRGNLQTHADTSPSTFTHVVMKERLADGKMEWFFQKRQCMHCTDAACVKVCPQKAVYVTEQGAVARDTEKCIGCDYCVQYCPFGIPKINESAKKMYKCTLCNERTANNLKPACVRTCPTGALQFGPRHEMVNTAQERLAQLKKTYPAAGLYGLDEQFLSGTNVFYLLLEKPEFYGLPVKPQIPLEAVLWQDYIQPMGKLFPLGAIGAIMVSAFMTRVAVVNQSKHSGDSEGGNVHG